MSKLRITLVDTVNKRRLTVNLPDDVPLEQLVPALARKLGLPQGEYALTVEETGAPLAAGVTLAGAGVGEGVTLRLERAAPEAPPARPAPPPPAPPPPQAPVIQPTTEALGRAVKGFDWRIALLCVAGSVLGSTLSWTIHGIPRFAVGPMGATFLQWATWGGVWAGIMGISLKPRRAWGLLGAGTVGLGTFALLAKILYQYAMYRHGFEPTPYWVIWLIIGSIWGLAIAVAFELPKRRIALGLVGAFGLGVDLPLVLTLASAWGDWWIAWFALAGLVPGLLLGGALGLFYSQREG